jgi:hypothetical protein
VELVLVGTTTLQVVLRILNQEELYLVVAEVGLLVQWVMVELVMNLIMERQVRFLRMVGVVAAVAVVVLTHIHQVAEVGLAPPVEIP